MLYWFVLKTCIQVATLTPLPNRMVYLKKCIFIKRFKFQKHVLCPNYVPFVNNLITTQHKIVHLTEEDSCRELLVFISLWFNVFDQL